jgi:hypothetical protein
MCRTPILVRESAFFLGERLRKNRFLRYDGKWFDSEDTPEQGRQSIGCHGGAGVGNTRNTENAESPRTARKEDETMTDQPDKLDLRSHDIAADGRQEILRLFPDIRTEGGKIDFDRLKLALGETVDVGKERYGLNWPGKADCFKAIQTPSLGTLRPCPEESVNFDTTENLIIEGDNLEVLKLLQKSYLGKVKMIYIDPPYNTGNDFIYPDNYAESLQTYLEYTGQVDAEGKKFSTNTEADGRFHSKWLNMMYPRLYLARNLLREDGVIFISIDDNELDNLRKLCNEVYGEEAIVGTIVWRRRQVSDNRNLTNFSPDHEYVLADKCQVIAYSEKCQQIAYRRIPVTLSSPEESCFSINRRWL